jgi:hypothetical protein
MRYRLTTVAAFFGGKLEPNMDPRIPEQNWRTVCYKVAIGWGGFPEHWMAFCSAELASIYSAATQTLLVCDGDLL